MITSHATFVLLAERRGVVATDSRTPAEPARRPRAPRLGALLLDALSGLRRNVSSTDVDATPVRSSWG